MIGKSVNLKTIAPKSTTNTWICVHIQNDNYMVHIEYQLPQILSIFSISLCCFLFLAGEKNRSGLFSLVR